MSKKTTETISVFIFSLYFGAILFFVFGAILQIRTGSYNAQRQFDILKVAAEKNADQLNFMSGNYVESLKNVINSDKRLITATIDNASGVQFAYPLVKPFITVNENSEPVIQVSSPLIKTFSANFSVSDTGYAVITAAIYTLLPETLVFYGKISFFIVLAGTLTAVLTGILSQSAGFSSTPVAPQKNTEKKPLSAAVKKEEFKTETPILTDTNEIEKEMITTSYDDKTDEELFDREMESLLYDDAPPEENSKPDESEIVQNTTDAVKNNETGIKKQALDPMGLFSPKTGLGWESYLETRLDAELIRSASSEQNLALMLICVPQITHDNSAAKEIADTIANYFNFRDLLFEFGQDSYAIIIQDTDINQAMVYAENIYSDIKKITGGISGTGIGISTRAQRLITGSRLINEAGLALKKSFEEKDLPIVAFKVNAEKYRKYLNEELRHGLTEKAGV